MPERFTVFGPFHIVAIVGNAVQKTRIFRGAMARNCRPVLPKVFSPPLFPINVAD